MKYRQLGRSGLYISEISFGTWLTVGMGVEKQSSFALLDKAMELGINFIDTADMYNKGESEKAIGEWLNTKKREEVIIGTKVFGPMSDNWMSQGLSIRHIRNACEASLQRLQTDYIDLYQCHRPDIDVPIEETCFAMHNLIEGGLIHYWGVSQWTAVQILQAVRICEKNGWRKPISNQPIYNLINRSLEIDVMQVCQDEGLGIVVYSPLAQGLLTGKYGRNNTPSDSRAASEIMGKMFPSKRMTDEFYNQMDQLSELAANLNISVSHLALSWILSRTPVTSAIVGASRTSQLEDNAASVAVKLDEVTLEKIETIMRNAPVDQYSGTRIGYGIIKRGY